MPTPALSNADAIMRQRRLNSILLTVRFRWFRAALTYRFLGVSVVSSSNEQAILPCCNRWRRSVRRALMRPRTRVRSASRRSNSELRLRRRRRSTARVRISATTSGISSGFSSAAYLRAAGQCPVQPGSIEHQQPEVSDRNPAHGCHGSRRIVQLTRPWSSLSFSSFALPGWSNQYSSRRGPISISTTCRNQATGSSIATPLVGVTTL